MVIKIGDLQRMTLEELQALASQVGVGYAGLGQEALREKLILESG